MPKTYIETTWRATHVPRTENRRLVRTTTVYPQSSNGAVQWGRGESTESGAVTIPVNEIAQVIAELAGALEAERAEEN